jgi:hypothetical protein
VEVQPTLNLWDITSKFRTGAAGVIAIFAIYLLGFTSPAPKLYYFAAVVLLIDLLQKSTLQQFRALNNGRCWRSPLNNLRVRCVFIIDCKK